MNTTLDRITEELLAHLDNLDAILYRLNNKPENENYFYKAGTYFTNNGEITHFYMEKMAMTRHPRKSRESLGWFNNMTGEHCLTF